MINNKIRELIIQTDEWLEENAQSDRWEREQKFAELIVAECLDRCYHMRGDSGPVTADLIRLRIKSAFGIE